MKVLCIGEALIDMICTDVNVSLKEGQHFIKKAGGAPANVAAAIAALGGKVSMAAKVGDDPFGQHLTDLLEKMGVETSLLIKDKNYFTTFAFVSLMNEGERDFYFNRGADKELTLEDLHSLQLKEYSIVHFGSATAFLPGPLQMTYQKLLQSNVFESTAISIITEPAYYERDTIVTEKTLMAIYGGTVPLWFGGWRIPDYMRSLGFDVFDDIIDHSYQNLPDPEQRCREAVNRNIHLLKNLTVIDHKRLQHNLDLVKSNPWQTQVNNLIKTYPDLRTVLPA